jgi:hypothetical protein
MIACTWLSELPVVMTRARLPLLFCFVLQACVSVDEAQLRPGIFDIATPATGFINSEDRARVILDLRARELCPQGFGRFSESRIVDRRAIEFVVWRIACTIK